MVDVQTISITIASASTVAAVVYYILQIQHQKKMRDKPACEIVFGCTERALSVSQKQ